MPAPIYHIYVEYKESEKSGIRYNIPQEELVRTFITPFTSGQPFWFMGRLLNPLKVVKVALFWSRNTADKICLPNQEPLVAAKDKKYLLDSVLKGKVKGVYLCTEKYLSVDTTITSSSNLGVLGGIRRIFVISGSDDAMKQAVATTLTKLELTPVVMHEQPGHGRKIFDQLSDYVDIEFAVVLLSPDEFAYAKEEPQTKRKLRPRQDVLFALGFFLGKLGKNNVLVFYKECENFEVPTDFEGIKFVPFDDLDSWKLALVRELITSGYQVDVKRIIK